VFTCTIYPDDIINTEMKICILDLNVNR